MKLGTSVLLMNFPTGAAEAVLPDASAAEIEVLRSATLLAAGKLQLGAGEVKERREEGDA